MPSRREHPSSAKLPVDQFQPNFRGSTGYGKKHLNAGNKQWGLKMHDDLIDCVAWAVKEGIANARKVGIMGGSYGGYCAFAALTFTPETFACSVDIVGSSNLKNLIGTIPPYWKPMRAVFDVRAGGTLSAEGAAAQKPREERREALGQSDPKAPRSAESAFLRVACFALSARVEIVEGFTLGRRAR